MDRRLALFANEAAGINARLTFLHSGVDRLARQATEKDAQWIFVHRSPRQSGGSARYGSLVHSLQVQPTESSRWNSALYLVTSRQLLVSARQNDRLLRSVSVQRPHYRNPRQHFRPVAFGNQYQRFHRDLPIGSIVLGFRQRGDVFGGVAQRQQLRPSGKTMGSTNRLNQATSRTGIIVSDVKRQQSHERKQQH
jgi:hypothetical protein